MKYDQDDCSSPLPSRLAASRGPASAQDKGTIGISMPTKSSARWISDGDSMVKVLEGQGLQGRPAIRRGRHPEPARAGREHDHQGVKVLVIAAIDGTTLSERAAEGGRQRHQGHRLRPPDQGLEERRLLRHLRQLPGRRAAGQLDRRQARPEAGQGPVQHRAVRRLARRQQRLLLLRRRDVGAASPTSTAASSSCAASRWAWTRSARCAGTARSRRRAWTTCCRAYYGKARSMPCCRPTTACRSASCRR